MRQIPEGRTTMVRLIRLADLGTRGFVLLLGLTWLVARVSSSSLLSPDWVRDAFLALLGLLWLLNGLLQMHFPNELALTRRPQRPNTRWSRLMAHIEESDADRIGRNGRGVALMGAIFVGLIVFFLLFGLALDIAEYYWPSAQ